MQIRGRDIDVRFWLPIICVIIILMLLPLHYSDYRSQDSYFSFRTVLFQIYNYPNNDSPVIVLATLTRLFAAICICIPAVYMNYRLAKLPWKQIDRKLSLSVFLGTIVLAWYFSSAFPPWELHWLFDPGYYNSNLWDLDSFGTMIITFLIIIPLLVREMKIVGGFRESPVEIIDNANTNEKNYLENSDIQLSRRYSIIGAVLGLIAIILPALIIFESSIDFIQFQGSTILFSIFFENSGITEPFLNFYINLEDPLNIFTQLPYAGFQLLFVYGILRYFQGILSKKRVYLLGVLSLVVPFVYRAFANFVNGNDGTQIIPFPVVLIIGLLVLKKVKPVDSVLQSRRKSTLHEPIETIQGKQSDRIKIPLLYVVKSKFSNLLRRSSENGKSQFQSGRQ